MIRGIKFLFIIFGMASLSGLLFMGWRTFHGDPLVGSKLAEGRCSSCHDMSSARKNMRGPYLWGIVGRTAGSALGFEYSESFLEFAREKHLVWDRERLDSFIADPGGFLPGSRMSDRKSTKVTIDYKGMRMVRSKHALYFDGVKDASWRRDLISFLETLKDG